MPVATLTSKGQLTLPKKVRDHLNVQTGDTVEFVIDADGDVRVKAGEVDVADLKGLLHQPGRPPVTLDEMDAAIQRAQGARRRT